MRKFSDFVEPDESYHGISYTKTYGNNAYIVKARMQLMRDFGCYPAANSAFLLNLGLETLAIRMKHYCENAMIVAAHLEASDKVVSVSYPGLKTINIMNSEKIFAGRMQRRYFVYYKGRKKQRRQIYG